MRPVLGSTLTGVESEDGFQNKARAMVGEIGNAFGRTIAQVGLLAHVAEDG